MSISQFDVFAMLGADFVDYSFLPATNTCGGGPNCGSRSELRLSLAEYPSQSLFQTPHWLQCSNCRVELDQP